MELTDDGLPDWAAAMGLPGIADVHTHFLPPRMMRRVREHFDNAGPLIGRPWPIVYRGTDEERVQQLDAMGVRMFSALAYAHRADMAADLNDWTLAFAEATPGCLPSMTFFPEPGAPAYVASALDRGARIAKLHLQVGGFDPADPLLDDVWGTLADARLPVVVHAGSGPVRAAFTGPEPLDTGAASSSTAVGDHRAHGCPGIRRFHRSCTPLSTGAPRHDDGRDRLLHRGGAASAGVVT